MASKRADGRTVDVEDPRVRRPAAQKTGGRESDAGAKPVKTATRVDWFLRGMRDGAEWKRRASTRGTFDPGEVDKIADMMTSNYYNKGLKNNPEGQKRYIRGFRTGVLGK
jgi:hypothetical protein